MTAISDLEPTLKLWIHGATGRMGRLIAEVSQDMGWEIIGKSDKDAAITDEISRCDLLTDFSSLAGNVSLRSQLGNHLGHGGNLPRAILIGSTGLGEDLEKSWQCLADDNPVRFLLCPNTSLGISLTLRAALSIGALARDNGFDIEIVETHHRHKKDQPSGTALYLGDHLAEDLGLSLNTNRQGPREKEEIGVHAIRGGGVFGEHEIRLISDHEEIYIGHRAMSRRLFARGALVLGRLLVSKDSGTYETRRMIQDQL